MSDGPPPLPVDQEPEEDEDQELFREPEATIDPLDEFESLKEDRKEEDTPVAEVQPKAEPKPYTDPISVMQPDTTPPPLPPKADEDKLSIESDEVKAKPPEFLSTATHSDYDDPDSFITGGLDGELTVTVSDPEKVGDGMGAYVAYTIVTKTTLSMFKSPEATVRRRFSDFLGLYAKLVGKHASKGILVPTPPEKSVLGMTKVKFSKENQSESEFIERRRISLERFLNRIALQPELRKDPDFIDFLENSQELPKSKDTSAMSGAGFMRLVKGLGDAVKSAASKKTEADQWFEKKIEEYDMLDTHLKYLHQATEDLSSYRKDLVTSNGAAAKSIAVLGNVEEEKGVAHALARLAEVEDKLGQLHSEQHKEDLFSFSERIKDYIGLLGAVRQLFQMRDKAYQTWQNAQSTVVKKKEAELKFKASGKTDKLAQAQAEITEWEKKSEDGQKNYSDISQKVKSEIKLFELRRAKELKEMMTQYLEKLLKQQEEVLNMWESYAPDVKAI